VSWDLALSWFLITREGIKLNSSCRNGDLDVSFTKGVEGIYVCVQIINYSSSSCNVISHHGRPKPLFSCLIAIEI